MKIAFIGQKGIPATFGGIEYHVDRLSRHLAAAGHDVTVYVRSWYTSKKLNHYQGVRLIHVPTIKSKHLDASLHSFFCTLHALFRNYDIIHFHAIGPSFFSIIPRIFGKKVISTVHRLDWDTSKWGGTARFLLKIGEHVSILAPHQTIVVSKDLQKYFMQKYSKQTFHISHGFDNPDPRLPDIINNIYGLGSRDFILFMGRLTPEKRVDWLIRVFQGISNRMINGKKIKLVIAGGSSSTKDYVRLLRSLSSGDPDIIYTGYVTGEEKAELLSNAWMFTLPSSLEGFPIVLIEAKSYGLCSLVSDIPAHLESIQAGIDGYFFHSKDLENFQTSLQFLFDNPDEVERSGKAAKEFIKKQPGWDSIVKETIHVYRLVIRDESK